jgi:hypothetical protein
LFDVIFNSRLNVGFYSWHWEVISRIAGFARLMFMQFLHMAIAGSGMGFARGI